MIVEGKYIYGIIKQNKQKSFGFIGIDNQEVKLVHYQDIAAVTSDSPIINLDRLDKKELLKHVATHQKVNEEISKKYDVIPMSFGIIAPTTNEVLSILEKASLQFKTALKKISGKAEFIVHVCCDQKKLLEELVNTNPEIRKLKESLSTRSEVLGLSLKLKLGKLIQQQAEAQKQAYLEDIQTFMNSLADDFTSNKLIEDEMIANFSLLIEKAREAELDRKMAELGKRYEGKLSFKYIGPMPPYSFVNINLSLGNFELIDEARKLLGLYEQASLDEIKKAFYFLAHQYHPDKQQNNWEKIQEQMKRINQAYNILENYCQGCDKSVRKIKGRNYSFKEEDVKNSVMII